MHIADAHCFICITQYCSSPASGCHRKSAFGRQVKTQVFAAFANAAKLGADTAQA